MSAVPDAGRHHVIDGLSVRCFGDPAHPSVLLSPGLGGSGAYWAPQVAALARDHQVILYDHRGTGQSARDPLPASYSAEHLAADLGCVLDGLALPSAHLVGHAAGALAALAFARQAPERALTLTLVNGWAKADPHFIRCFDIRMGIYDAGGALAYLRAQPLFLYPAGWISDHLAQLDEEAAGHAASFQDRSTLAARIGALSSFDARPWLSHVNTPALIVASQDDMLVPSGASRPLADGLAHSRFESFERGGHAVNVTQAGRFNHILHSYLLDHRMI